MRYSYLSFVFLCAIIVGCTEQPEESPSRISKNIEQVIYAVDTILKESRQLPAKEKKSFIVSVDGEEVPVQFTGDFSWTSSDLKRARTRVYEGAPRTLIYDTRKIVSRAHSETGVNTEYEISVPSKIEFYDTEGNLRKKILVDQYFPDQIKNSKTIWRYGQVDPESFHNFSVDLDENSANEVVVFPYVSVDKTGRIILAFVAKYNSDKCQCIFLQKTWTNILDKDGDMFFDNCIVDKAVYDYAISESGEYLSISWDELFSMEQDFGGKRGVVFVNTASKEEVYSVDLSLAKGYLTRATLQSDGETFVYKIRERGNKEKDFYSTYVIVSLKKNMILSRDFSLGEWDELVQLDWSMAYPDNVLEAFEFEKINIDRND